MNKKISIILLVLFLFLTVRSVVLAEEVTNTPPNQKKIDLVCIQNAIEKRENAIIVAFDKKAVAIKAALEARKNALKEAWTKPTRKERLTARLAAWKNFRTAKWQIQKTYQTEVKSAWKTFNTERKNCKITEPVDESNASDLAL